MPRHRRITVLFCISVTLAACGGEKTPVTPTPTPTPAPIPSPTPVGFSCPLPPSTNPTNNCFVGHPQFGTQVNSSIDLVMATRPELSPWLSGVFVAPEHRRRGVGGALVERVVLEACVLRTPRLYLYTLGSEALYLRLRWSVMERTFYRELWGEQKVTIMELATHAP